MKALKHQQVVGTFPTSVTQKRCWFMDQIHPGNKGLNLAIRWELRGPVTSDMVQTAFQKIVDRHEIFRTRFIEQNGEPLQEVFGHVDFKLDLVDIRNVPEEDRAERINSIAVAHSEEPFDLSKPCLFRVAMVPIETERAALLISVHNSVFDGFSIGVLGHELGMHLEALLTGTDPKFPELSLQYGDYSMWLADYEQSGGMDDEEAYWKRTLEGMEYFELPLDRPRAPSEPEPRSITRELPGDFETSLSEIARELDTSVFTLGVSAFSIALERFSGRSDVSFAIQVAGRTEIDLEPLIGIFTNPIVMRFDIDANKTLIDQSRAARDVVNSALAHQTLPFDKLVKVLNPPRDPLRIPLVSVMFNLQRVFLNERKYGDIELVSVQSHSPGTLYDLNVNVIGRNSGWRLAIDYNANLFNEATIKTFSDVLLEAFQALMRRDDVPISAIAPNRSLEANAAPLEPKKPRFTVKQTPPPNSVKPKLAALWSDILALPVDQVDGDFFELGGYSVLALQMLSRVGENFQARPSLHAFLSEPTLDGLTGLLGQAEPVLETHATPQAVSTPNSIWAMAELKSSPETAPVLLTVNQPFLYQSLGKEIEATCAVANIGVADRAQLQALSQAGFDPAIDAAAALVQGRYAGRDILLCGLCVDGRVALRLAERLNALGERVRCVGMIDTWAPGAIGRFTRFQRARDKWTIRLRRLRYYLALRWRGQISTTELLGQNDFLQRVLEVIKLVKPTAPAAALVDDTVDVLVKQTRTYKFDTYDGEVVLFVTRSQAMVPEDGILGWSELLPADTAVYQVNGWHGDSLMRSGFGRISEVFDAKARRLESDRAR
ncbi:condensation domain-containing protein [Ruegeria arenilitoris]|uniref:condensation domain-containing protein n=1 Tax=Ruegeria arenilitoris TaxID=1173585 RepID=UPI00266FEC5A|nr:condensation domain-containing protein [Ruegeria arenilitoris]